MEIWTWGVRTYGAAVRINGLPSSEGQFEIAYEVEVELMYHPKINYAPLTPGVTFQLMMGPKTVGEGVVISPIYSAPK